MSTFSSLLPDAAGVLACAHKVVYGPGYRRARLEAFQRSGGICQFCGLRPAEEAHHWSRRYPPDEKITADHLTALCRLCHRAATLRRLFARTQAGVWFILALATPPVRRQRVARHRPRDCRGPEPSAASHPATRATEPDLHALIERCHLELVAGCLACERYVRLDAVLLLRRCGRSTSLTELGRRLCCGRCRSRTRWVLLAGWPADGTGGAAARRAGGDTALTGREREPMASLVTPRAGARSGVNAGTGGKRKP